jgi:hypothetical protein
MTDFVFRVIGEQYGCPAPVEQPIVSDDEDDDEEEAAE